MPKERVLLSHAPTGATRVAAVIGSPIAHSLSPVLHNAAFRAADLDWVFVALEVAAADGEGAIDAMRRLGLAGLSVTMPHKQSVIAALDELTPMAARLGAVNCVFWSDGRLIGDNTDGAGVLWALEGHLRQSLADRRVAVIGAGGAARAAIAALATTGVSEVVVVNRTAARAAEAVELAGGIGRHGTIADLADMDIVINATSVGMGALQHGSAEMPTPIEGWDAPVVMDLIYHPAETQWLRGARLRGAVVCNGVPMLVGQAAAAFERWTGIAAPVDAMAGVVDHLVSHQFD